MALDRLILAAQLRLLRGDELAQFGELIGTGIVAAGLLLTDDNDDADDEPVSPFE